MANGRHPGGRPTKLTPETHERIVNAIRAGGYVETAAAMAGLRKDTFYAWLRRGARASKGIYREFSDAVEKAVAEAEMRNVMILTKAANGYDTLKTRTVTERTPEGDFTTMVTEEKGHDFSPQAAEWWLERRFPNRWGRRDFMEVTGDQERPVQIKQQVSVYDPGAMASLLAAWVEAKIVPQDLVQLIGEGNGAGPEESGGG